MRVLGRREVMAAGGENIAASGLVAQNQEQLSRAYRKSTFFPSMSLHRMIDLLKGAGNGAGLNPPPAPPPQSKRRRARKGAAPARKRRRPAPGGKATRPPRRAVSAPGRRSPRLSRE